MCFYWQEIVAIQQQLWLGVFVRQIIRLLARGVAVLAAEIARPMVVVVAGAELEQGQRHDAANAKPRSREALRQRRQRHQQTGGGRSNQLGKPTNEANPRTTQEKIKETIKEAHLGRCLPPSPSPSPLSPPVPPPALCHFCLLQGPKTKLGSKRQGLLQKIGKR